MIKEFQYSNNQYSIKDLQTILKSKNPYEITKQDLLEQLDKASTKEEFSSINALLLSIHNQTLTIPLNYNKYFSILQFKKRYNKKIKKTQIDFYAALELLGPISGILTLDVSDATIDLNVAFDKTKNFLENDMNDISYKINTINKIEPLYDLKLNSILDINV